MDRINNRASVVDYIQCAAIFIFGSLLFFPAYILLETVTVSAVTLLRRFLAPRCHSQPRSFMAEKEIKLLNLGIYSFISMRISYLFAAFRLKADELAEAYDFIAGLYTLYGQSTFLLLHSNSQLCYIILRKNFLLANWKVKTPAPASAALTIIGAFGNHCGGLVRLKVVLVLLVSRLFLFLPLFQRYLVGAQFILNQLSENCYQLFALFVNIVFMF